MAKKKSVKEKQPTWNQLNVQLKNATSDEARALMDKATINNWPTSYLLRIQQRVNRTRASDALKELINTK